MTPTNKKTPPRIYARQQLSRYASRERFPDGWLPPERVLCEEIGVSRGTLRKALAQLISEGYVIGVPPKGNYITGAPPRLNIGIVLGDGVLSDAAVSVPHMLSGVMDVLGDAGAGARILSPKGPAQVEETCRRYELDGLVWCYPPTAAIPVIDRIIARGELALVVPTLIHSFGGDRFPSRNYVTLDYANVGRRRAEYFISRRCRKIAYLGDTPENETFRRFEETLAAAGIRYDMELLIPEIERIPDVLPRLLREGRVDAVVSNGGPSRIENLFRALDEYDDRQNINLLIDHIPALPEMMARHPSVPVAAINVLPHRETGETAAKALLRALKNGWDGHPILLETTIQRLT